MPVLRTRTRSRIAVGLIAFATAAAVTVSLGAVSATAAPPATAPTRGQSGHVWHVGPNVSIQNVVRASHKGDTIILKRGVYHQSVTIRRNGITLRGSGSGPNGTVFKPPSHMNQKLCRSFAGMTGVCVFARRVSKSGAVRRPVNGVEIKNIRFVGFENGVFAYGANRLVMSGNAALHNDEYGLARFNSTFGAIRGNLAVDNGEAGLYLGDSPEAHASITGNTVRDNGFGIFVRHSHHVRLADNTAVGNCIGTLVFDDGQPEGAGDVTISDSVYRNNDKVCPNPPVGGSGIALIGASNTTVTGNTITDNTGSTFVSSGVAVLSAGPITGGADEINVAVRRNQISGNIPYDLLWDEAGTNITFNANGCTTSQPGGLC